MLQNNKPTVLIAKCSLCCCTLWILLDLPVNQCYVPGDQVPPFLTVISAIRVSTEEVLYSVSLLNVHQDTYKIQNNRGILVVSLVKEKKTAVDSMVLSDLF